MTIAEVRNMPAIEWQDPILDTLAKRRNHRVARWYGQRGGGRRRTYVCYLCGCEIDSEGAGYQMTKHAEQALIAHKEAHHRDAMDFALAMSQQAAVQGDADTAHEWLNVATRYVS